MLNSKDYTLYNSFYSGKDNYYRSRKIKGRDSHYIQLDYINLKFNIILFLER